MARPPCSSLSSARRPGPTKWGKRRKKKKKKKGLLPLRPSRHPASMVAAPVRYGGIWTGQEGGEGGKGGGGGVLCKAKSQSGPFVRHKPAGPGKAVRAISLRRRKGWGGGKKKKRATEIS